MVEGRFGLFAMGCGEGRRACAVLRSRACTAPEIRGSSEALRQSPYTFADMPTTRATCVAAFRTVRVRQHGLRGKHLVSCAFSNRTGVVHAWRDASTPRRCGTFVRDRSEEHTSELQSLMRISYAVFCLKNKPTH